MNAGSYSARSVVREISSAEYTERWYENKEFRATCQGINHRIAVVWEYRRPVGSRLHSFSTAKIWASNGCKQLSGYSKTFMMGVRDGAAYPLTDILPLNGDPR